ncbi:MAG: DNA polymerase I [Clostridia bacterium]|nr:DNA polymerase I [Clostridia bacterium]
MLLTGNSIVNRAFYGIMGGKMLQTADGTYTNAVYGFLAIMFKELEELKPEYIAVAFDLKAPTARHLMYEGYKATRKGMPEELAKQMPILKKVLHSMNIDIIEMEGYEADDILGTLAKKGEEKGIEVILLTGDRDSFQLATDNVKIYIPRTKAGKTETEIYDRAKVIEEYGVEPVQMIEVKGLMGDTSDNIPGVPGIGEKTALSIIKEYGNIDNLYEKIETNTDNLKGKQREKIVCNKDLAILSRTLGTINVDVPIEKEIEDFKRKEWNKQEVLSIFEELRFNRYIERFKLKDNNELSSNESEVKNKYEIVEVKDKAELKKILEKLKKEEKIFFYTEYIEDERSRINKKVKSISISDLEENKVYYCIIDEIRLDNFKEIFENKNVLKCSNELKTLYIVLKENNIFPENFMFDVKIAGYLLNSTTNLYTIKDLVKTYLDENIDDYVSEKEEKQEQMNLFESNINDKEENKKIDEISIAKAYFISRLYKVLIEELKKHGMYELFLDVEMPVMEVLADMQYEGIYVEKQELIDFGLDLKAGLEKLTEEIYNLAGETFNINSPKQLGELLFEKLGLTIVKKTKSGYSTDVDTLEKIKSEHPIIDKILDYRQLMKLNSTYVDGMLPCINKYTNRIHSSFHQTVTATGRISSTEPNLQNIPTRIEHGKLLRKVFKPEKGKVFVDADYSQIELRLLAHISEDEAMVEAFNNNEDIHKQAASRVFGVPMEEVTKELRSRAKAVNFGIVYGISDFGLAEQIGASRKEAKNYIEQYLEKYNGIKNFMTQIIDDTKEKGYVETVYHRRRYVPELNAKNYMVRKFGERVAMNTPIQGTAADIMKVAMINVYKELKKRKLNSKIILQIHDELLIETDKTELEEVTELLVRNMEDVIKLKVPLKADVSVAENWYEAK